MTDRPLGARSNLEHMAEFKRHTGLNMNLRPFETIEKIVLTDDTAATLVETFRYDDTTREFRFTARGERLTSYKLNEAGEWEVVGSLVMWDDSFVPFVQVKFGKSVSPREYAAQREWERQCYRPGTDKNPLDNYARVLAGPTTDAMERYW